MRTVLILSLLFCLSLPTASLARDISDIINAYGRSTADFEDSIKRMTGDTLEGRGTVIDVRRTGADRTWDVHIATGDEIGVVVVVPVFAFDIPFQWKNEVRFSGRIKSVAIRFSPVSNPPGAKYFLVILSDGDVHRAVY